MTEKPSHPDHSDPPRAPHDAAEERRRAEFAYRLTRDVFGRYYWNDRLQDEVLAAMKKRQ
ncbi:MAG: hypothetical protein KDE05_06210 [Parvularculaceae bacterium]|nr:hypothetical protein [Parvularculaceae bacterium]